MTAMMVLGIGNSLAGDDGAGNYAVRLLQMRLEEAKNQGKTHDIIAIDAGTVPESYTSIIRRAKPELLVLVDAAEMALPPGSIRLVKPERLKSSAFSTHKMPLNILIDYIKEMCGRVVMVGIQPGEAGTGLSAVVQTAAERLAEMIWCGCIDEIKPLE